MFNFKINIDVEINSNSKKLKYFSYNNGKINSQIQYNITPVSNSTGIHSVLAYVPDQQIIFNIELENESTSECEYKEIYLDIKNIEIEHENNIQVLPLLPTVLEITIDQISNEKNGVISAIGSGKVIFKHSNL